MDMVVHAIFEILMTPRNQDWGAGAGCFWLLGASAKAGAEAA